MDEQESSGAMLRGSEASYVLFKSIAGITFIIIFILSLLNILADKNRT